MAYSKIKSKFIKEQIKKISWKDREYIDHLIDIEKLVTGMYVSTGAGYVANSRKSDYPREWKIIYQELNPKGYKRAIEEERREDARERRENEKFRREERKELQQARQQWKKMGGNN